MFKRGQRSNKAHVCRCAMSASVTEECSLTLTCPPPLRYGDGLHSYGIFLTFANPTSPDLDCHPSPSGGGGGKRQRMQMRHACISHSRLDYNIYSSNQSDHYASAKMPQCCDETYRKKKSESCETRRRIMGRIYNTP